jgi:hypothetical protein
MQQHIMLHTMLLPNLSAGAAVLCDTATTAATSLATNGSSSRSEKACNLRGRYANTVIANKHQYSPQGPGHWAPLQGTTVVTVHKSVG